MSDTENINILGDRLKQIRTEKKISQKELSTLLGVTPASLSAYERGTKKPSLNVLVDIAKKCDVSLDWLCGLCENKTNSKDINTYSDIIELLVQISKTKILAFNDFLEHSEQVLFEDGFVNHTSITFLGNETLDLFLNDFKKMYNLYLNNSIDEDVYNLWIEKTLIKYNFPIYQNTNNEKNDDDDLPF